MSYVSPKQHHQQPQPQPHQSSCQPANNHPTSTAQHSQLPKQIEPTLIYQIFANFSQQSAPCKTNTCSCPASDNSYAASSSSSNVVYVTDQRSSDDTPPADPISVSLAVQAGKALHVPEAKLAYGFAQKPVDDLQKVHLSSVPEENLFRLNSEVITLKKPSRPQPADEEPEELEEEEWADDVENAPPQLTYKQLGYKTEQFKNPKFRRVLSKGPASRAYSCADADEAEAVPDKVSVDRGFRPGRIAAYGTAKQKQLEALDELY